MTKPRVPKTRLKANNIMCKIATIRNMKCKLQIYRICAKNKEALVKVTLAIRLQLDVLNNKGIVIKSHKNINLFDQATNRNKVDME